jgi:tetratricopeptide (TPR) repeat protein
MMKKPIEKVRIYPNLRARFIAQILTVKGLQHKWNRVLPLAMEKFTKAITVDSEFAWPYLFRAELFRQMGSSDKGLDDIEQAAKIAPEIFAKVKPNLLRAELNFDCYRLDEAVASFNQAIALNPNCVEAHLGLANHYQSQQNYDEAITHFSQAVALRQEEAAIYASRGNVYHLSHRLDEALIDFDRAIELDPQLTWVYFSRGQIYQVWGYHNLAIESFSIAIGQDAFTADYYGSRGYSYHHIWQVDAALSDYLQAIQYNPNLAWVVNCLAELYLYQGDFEQALANFESAIKLGYEVNWDTALNFYGQVLQSQPTLDQNVYAIVLAHRGRLQQSLKKFHEALYDLDTAINICPHLDWAIFARCQVNRSLQQYPAALADANQVIFLDPSNLNAIAERSEVYISLQEFSLALLDLNFLIEIQTSNASLLASRLANRGEIYQILGDEVQALEDYSRAIDLDKNQAWALAKRGHLHLNLGNYGQAIDDLNKAIEKDYSIYWARSSRGIAKQFMEEHEEAINDLSLSKEDEEKYSPTILGQIVAIRGTSHLSIGQYTQALKDFLRAFEINPQQQGVNLKCGQTYQELMQYDQSLNYFTQEITLNPASDWAYTCRGISYMRLYRYDEALHDFNQAITINPDNDFAFFNRGKLFLERADFSKALSDFNQAIFLNPESAEYYYYRALQALQGNGSQAVAQLDLQEAIRLGIELCTHARHKSTILALAAYHLAADQIDEAQKLYNDALCQGVVLHEIRKGIDQLTDLINFNPNHKQAQHFRQLLQSLLWRGTTSDESEVCLVIPGPIEDLTEKLKEVSELVLRRDHWFSKVLDDRIQSDPENAESKYLEEAFPKEVKVYQIIEQDIDGDGQMEICFAAGLPSYFGNGLAGILDPWGEGYRFIQLVTYEGGYRDLRVLDINQDDVSEIVFLSQVGSGAYLSPYIFQWQSNCLTSLFDQVRFHQGYMDIKDLDADGIDELIFWEGLWEGSAHWAPTRFNIHIYHYDQAGYILSGTQRSNLPIEPAEIVSRDIGIWGMPLKLTSRMQDLSQLRSEFKTLLDKRMKGKNLSKRLTKYIDKLINLHEVERNETFYQTALAILELANEAVSFLPNQVEQSKYLISLFFLKAILYYSIGSYAEALISSENSLKLLEDTRLEASLGFSQIAIHRNIGILGLQLYDFPKALKHFSIMEQLLKEREPLATEDKEQLSALFSNFGLLYKEMGNLDLAVEYLERAINLDHQLQRQYGLSINFTALGEIQRSQKKLSESLQSFQSALEGYTEASDREKESDIYLQMGLTLALENQLSSSLEKLHQSLLLTTTNNFFYLAGIHYLSIGEVYRQVGDIFIAHKYLHKALSLSQQTGYFDTRWKAFYGLALTCKNKEQVSKRKELLVSAIQVIERLRSQTLPEEYKISIFSEKIAPYVALIISCQDDATVDAFNYSERAKSRSFIEDLAITSFNPKGNFPLELLQKECKLIEQLREIQAQQRDRTHPKINFLGNQIEQIDAQLNQVWEEIVNTVTEGEEYVSLRRGIPLDFQGVKLLLSNA